jgi:hypothetical protein
MIWNVAYLVGSAVGSGGAARPGAEVIVSWPRLTGRLGVPARVTVVSGPGPGSGKTVPLRSWINQAGAAGCAAWVRPGAACMIRSGWLSVLGAPRQTDPGAVPAQPLAVVADLVAPGAFIVRIRPPATDEDRRQERPGNR